MAELRLDKRKTALLMADFSAGNMAQNPLVHEGQTFERAAEVLAAARKAGLFVIPGETTYGTAYDPRPRSPDLSMLQMRWWLEGSRRAAYPWVRAISEGASPGAYVM